MAISDKIENFIIELLKDDTSEWLELGRNELAGIFNCVPSQINYVLGTRFTPEKGYIVESRRGGGGYIRIRKNAELVDFEAEEILKSISDTLTTEKAEKIINYLYITEQISEDVRLTLDACITNPALTDDILRSKLLIKSIKTLINRKD